MPISPTQAAVEARRLSRETEAARTSGDLPRLQRALAAETHWIAKRFGMSGK
jgi:hypothetical protein